MKGALLILILNLTVLNLFSQNHSPIDSTRKTHSITGGHIEVLELMPHLYSLSVPMARNSSGTSWLPDLTPVYGFMGQAGGWNIMVDYNIFLRANMQNFSNGGKMYDTAIKRPQYDIPNWIMGSAQHKIGRYGQFSVTAMLSAETWTIGPQGYPLIFASGEYYQNRRLIDRQHPHDFIGALTMGYTYMLNKKADILLYAGFPGEPAFGPGAFMHRPSGNMNPDAPIAHHWQDGMHTQYGVITGGIRYGIMKGELSLFTAREPDENRTNFDTASFNSYAIRLSAAPSVNWIFPASYANLQGADKAYPYLETHKFTASAIHSLKLGLYRNLNTTAVLGINGFENRKNYGNLQGSFLLESSYGGEKGNLYTRFETVQKSAEQLDLKAFSNKRYFGLTEFTVGAQKRIFHAVYNNFLVGAQFTANFAPKELEFRYGTSTPLSAEAYIRITPPMIRNAFRHEDMDMKK